MIQIVEHPIDAAAVLASVAHPNCGANLLFCGTTRKLTNSRETSQLEYECYREMAIKQLRQLVEETKSKFGVHQISLVHRIGTVDVGETSIAVAIGSPHRMEAFQAGEWLMNELKKRIPIWKKEIWADGSVEWQHPAPAENQ